MKRTISFAAGILVLALVFSAWAEARRPQPMPLTPTLTGETEYCLTCHADLEEISPSHPVETYGCVVCHGGERLALDADLAHSTMRGGKNPSDLAVVEESCGGSDCHSGQAADERDHIQRVLTSVQATYAGAIANIRYTFGAQPDLNAYLGTRAVQDTTTQTGITSLAAFDPARETNPALQTFAENCLECHLNSEPRPGDEYARFSGCAACHTPTATTFPPRSRDAAEGLVHTLTTAIPYTQCNTCHNRGNYDLRTMTFAPRDDQPADRIHDYYQPIAQFTRCEWTLDCIDCHTRSESMGDGDIHNNQKEIQYVQCRTCHGTLDELPHTRTLTDPNDLAFRLAALNQGARHLELGDTIIVTETGEPLWNTRQLPDGTFELVGKATRQYFTFRPVMGTACEQKPDEQESRYCHQCHSAER
ncbi:MAG: hypothetical protein GXP40_04010 [Chloroflexi bacterium]|nr:hypothetical protein [Chloroflexota bacterium]